MVGIEHGPYQDALAAYGKQLRPSAIVAVSAHWGSSTSVSISSAERFRATHDFGGFPRPLFELTYAPPGSPARANRIADRFKKNRITTELVDNNGLDHGVRIPLRLMYPEAQIPVAPLSVPLDFTPQRLYELGQALAPLRSEGVLILGSGGIVHNLRMFRGGPIDQPVEAWAAEFDTWFKDKVEHDVAELLRYDELAPHAAMAVPTFEHFAPAFIALGAADGYSHVDWIFEGFQYGAI
jgi:4,5-DOPA dioxygenase extradiol